MASPDTFCCGSQPTPPPARMHMCAPVCTHTHMHACYAHMLACEKKDAVWPQSARLGQQNQGCISAPTHSFGAALCSQLADCPYLPPPS